MPKAQAHHRETFSSLLATHEAIRVAQDVGYPPLRVPPPPAPQYIRHDEVIYEPDPEDFYEVADAPPPPDFSTPVGLIVFFVLCLVAVLVFLMVAVCGVLER